MSEETIALIIFLGLNFIIGVSSVIAHICICKTANLKSISKDELNFKTFEWYLWTVHYDLSSYTWLSRKRILKNYKKFKEYLIERNQKVKEEKRKQKNLYF